MKQRTQSRRARQKTDKASDELPVGRIAALFGVRGELKCDPSNAGRMLFERGQHFRVQLPDGSERRVELVSARAHQGRLLVAFANVGSADEAEAFIGSTLYAQRSQIKLEPNEYLDEDLTGCSLFDPEGRNLGRVERVEHYPGSDMLVVDGRLVPLIDVFVKSVDLAAKRIEVELPAGLLED